MPSNGWRYELGCRSVAKLILGDVRRLRSCLSQGRVCCGYTPGTFNICDQGSGLITEVFHVVRSHAISMNWSLIALPLGHRHQTANRLAGTGDILHRTHATFLSEECASHCILTFSIRRGYWIELPSASSDENE